MRDYRNIKDMAEDFTSDIDDRIDDLIELSVKSDAEMELKGVNPSVVCRELIDGIDLTIEKLMADKERVIRLIGSDSFE